MDKLGKAMTVASIFGILATAWDQAAQRRRNRDLDARDRRIRDLEDRIARLEHPGARVVNEGVVGHGG